MPRDDPEATRHAGGSQSWDRLSLTRHLTLSDLRKGTSPVRPQCKRRRLPFSKKKKRPRTEEDLISALFLTAFTCKRTSTGSSVQAHQDNCKFMMKCFCFMPKLTDFFIHLTLLERNYSKKGKIAETKMLKSIFTRFVRNKDFPSVIR